MRKLKTKIVCIGKIKEDYLRKGISHYSDNVEIIELVDEKAEENLSDAQKENVKTKEGIRILNKIKSNEYVVTLDIIGKELTTDKLRNKINSIPYEYDTVTFIIGGSLGISEDVKKRSNFAVSFSKMTFPHQLMRLVLLEQIYKI